MLYRRMLQTLRFTLLVGVAPMVLAAENPSAHPVVAPASKPSAIKQVGLLKVERFGDAGRPIILIPGLAGGTWVWQDTIAELSQDHTVYAVTLAGFDGTQRPSGEGAWLDRVDASLSALIRQEGMEKPVLVGHSVGGTISLRFAGLHPDQVGGVVAVDGLPIFPGMERVSAEQRAMTGRRIAVHYETDSPDQYQADLLGYMQTVGTLDPNKAKRAAVLSARSDPKAVARYLEEDMSADFRGTLKTAKVPILEIVPFSEADAQSGPIKWTAEQKAAYYASLLANAPGAKVLTMAPSRHFVMLDQPAAFSKALHTFIDKH